MTPPMTPQEKAREKLKRLAFEAAGLVCHAETDDAVDAVLANVPLLMQALGAKQEWSPPLGNEERWVTPWMASWIRR